MNIDAKGEKEPPLEDKGVGNGQSLLKVNGLKVDVAGTVEKHESSSGLQGAGVVQVQQQQPQTQGSGVCWERFLHVRSIRVLLVENDDCTRQVVTALLQKCNYEVLDAANGMEAWKILEDLTNHVDIVLTELVMPCLSGIALLCKIMNHKTRKNIPVIMMSSHDSMTLVFRCLSRGAVDFLVKPIRKNELKNLWQHVWRKCHSSSGSGSESGTQTQKSVKSKRSKKSEDSESDEEENDGSNGLNVGDGSDDGSGAQSSWTKQVVEVDSSQGMSPMDQVAECQDSTCAQVIWPNAEHSGEKGLQIGAPRKVSAEKGNNLVTNVPRNLVPKSENPLDVPVSLKDSKLKSPSDCNAITNQVDKGQPNIKGDVNESESPGEKANCNATDDSKAPNSEPSLKRVRGVQDTGRSVQNDRYVLRRSEQSAFSRYNTSSYILKAPDGIAGCSSVLENSNIIAKRESVGDINAYSAEHLAYQSSNGVISNNNIDMGSTTNKLLTLQSINKDKSEGTPITNCLYTSAFGPVKNDLRYSQEQAVHLPNELQINDTSHRYYRHSHHHLVQQPSSNHDELKKLAADAPQGGSTNLVGGPTEGDPGNHSLNNSGSGSNHGSNGQNGRNTAIKNTLGVNSESDLGQTGKSGSGDASGSGSGNRLDENKLAQREAALIKFRQKKKDRCFKKKVRYHNRKKLAEQRPRVRGQFVKQTSGADSSTDRTGDE